VGLDPGAWRGLAAGLDSTLSLTAGLQIDFDASLSLGAGIGVSTGVESDLGSSLESSLGLEPEKPGSAGSPAASGFALSAAGGVGAAVEAVKIARAQDAAQSSARSFGAAGVSTSAAVTTGAAAPAVSGAAVAVAPAAPAPGPTSGAGAASGAATPVPTTFAPPRADARATSYGFGVPLRPRVGGAAETSQGVVALRPYPRATPVPVTRDPTVPAWEQLPAASSNLAPQTTRPIASKLGSVAAPAAPAAAGAGAGAKRGGGGGRGGRGGCGCGQTGRR
jgi:hypothetical protein